MASLRRQVASAPSAAAAAAADPCTVARKCSSTGKACGVDDRACQSAAVADGLEVICESTALDTGARGYVYCPPGAQQRDSGVVWILLAVALAVAAAGAILSWFVFRRRISEPS